jgi:hypothetical protein
VRIALAILLACAAGCSRPPLAANGDAGTGGQPMCPAPAACNDDPAMSALAGTCELNATTGDYSCRCGVGFSVNTATGRCRADTACDKSAGGPWAFGMRFDPKDCAKRPVTACATSSATRLETTIENFAAKNGCPVVDPLTIRIELVNGCPTLLEARSAVLPALPQQFLTCFEQTLATLRAGCASDCALIANEALGPVP